MKARLYLYIDKKCGGVNNMLPFYEIRKTDLTVKHNTYEVDFPEHMHSYIEIIYVFSGTQHITIENTEYAVNEGEAAVIFPDILHSYIQADKKNADALLIMCEPNLLGALFPNLCNTRPDYPVIPKDKINNETFYALHHINPDSNFEIKFSWTCIILSGFLSHLTLKQEHRIPVQDMTYKITQYIQQNFQQNITRDSLAEMFNVSKYYISRIFAQKFKMNLRTYLGIIRTEYAATLIRTTDATLTSISRDSGFDSLRTFNRVFKEIYGIPPIEYKNNIINFKNKSRK